MKVKPPAQSADATLEESLVTLIRHGDIEKDEALLCAIHPDDLEILLKTASA